MTLSSPPAMTTPVPNYMYTTTTATSVTPRSPMMHTIQHPAPLRNSGSQSIPPNTIAHSIPIHLSNLMNPIGQINDGPSMQQSTIQLVQAPTIPTQINSQDNSNINNTEGEDNNSITDYELNQLIEQTASNIVLPVSYQMASTFDLQQKQDQEADHQYTNL